MSLLFTTIKSFGIYTLLTNSMPLETPITDAVSSENAINPVMMIMPTLIGILILLLIIGLVVKYIFPLVKNQKIILEQLGKLADQVSDRKKNINGG